MKKAVSFGEWIIIKDRYPSVTSNTEAMKVITEDIAVSCNSWKTFIHRDLTMREFLSYLPEDLKVWKWMIMITKFFIDTLLNGDKALCFNTVKHLF